MCIGPFRPPSPPPLPKPEPSDSAIEDTADKVVVGRKRKKARSTMTASNIGRRLGTKSLQIPLLSGDRNTGTSNLNYPT